ncbi:MAG: hypothetical protein ABIB55_00845, partial [Candidatus Nealsonbacteria bacterium]
VIRLDLSYFILPKNRHTSNISRKILFIEAQIKKPRNGEAVKWGKFPRHFRSLGEKIYNLKVGNR